MIYDINVDSQISSDLLQEKNIILIIPGRGVLSTEYSFLNEISANLDGFSSVIVDGLYKNEQDDRGGPISYQNILNIIQKILQLKPDINIYLLGHSTGTRIALHHSKHANVRGVIALAVMSDLINHINACRQFIPDYVKSIISDIGEASSENMQYVIRSPVYWLDRINENVLLITGENDRVCPPPQTTILSEKLESIGIFPSTYFIPKADHFFKLPSFADSNSFGLIIEMIVGWLRKISNEN